MTNGKGLTRRNLSQRLNSTCPKTLQVVGRDRRSENHDIGGEYTYVNSNDGMAVYYKFDFPMYIWYCARTDQWIMNREGVGEVGCVAYAINKTPAHSHHPGHMSLEWHVFSAATNSFVRDDQIAVLDAPPKVCFVGRAKGANNWDFCGEYVLCMIYHGRPAYRHPIKNTILHYEIARGMWMVGREVHEEKRVYMFAQGADADVPSGDRLRWYFHEHTHQGFIRDPEVRCLACPERVHVVGSTNSEAVGILCGSFRAAWARNGRPVYVNDRNDMLLKHDVGSNCWVITDEIPGRADPKGLLNWLVPRSFTRIGPTIPCWAYAPTGSSTSPSANLQCYVKSPNSILSAPDPSVGVTCAPPELHVLFVGGSLDKQGLAGKYTLHCMYDSRPLWKKMGTVLYISSCGKPRRQWTICDSDRVRACLADDSDRDHPPQGIWAVFEISRGTVHEDPSLKVFPAGRLPQSTKRILAHPWTDEKRARLDPRASNGHHYAKQA